MSEDEELRVTEEEDFAESVLLLEPLTALEEEFAVATLLLDSSTTLLSEDEELRVTEEEDSFLMLEEDFAESVVLLEPLTALEEEFAVATLLLDSSLSLGETGEELPSSSQAARRSKLEIAKAIILFDFFRAT